MHVVITRPEQDSAELKSRIEDHGCRVSLAPLLTIELQHISAGALVEAGAVIATSRNGLRALARSDALAAALALPLFAVGPATSSMAASLGFRDIREGNGTATSLVPLIAATTFAGPLVHLAGDHQAVDLAGALADVGKRVTQLQAYRSVAAKTLPADIVESITDGAVDAVILMSPRSAATWAALMSPRIGRPELTQITHICLSPAVARALETLGPVKTLTAPKAVLEEIVALVYRLAADGKTG